jgi:hypothetical protein
MNTTCTVGRQFVDAHNCTGCIPAWRCLHLNNIGTRNVKEHYMHGRKAIVHAHNCTGCIPAWRCLLLNNTGTRNVNEPYMHGKTTVC